MSLRVLWPDVIEPPALGAAHPVGDSTLDDVEMLVYDAASPLPESVHDADVFVVWGRPSHLLPDDARALTMVRLVQGLMAGTEVLTAAGFADDAVVCSGVGLHDRPVAEHTLALVLALVRRLPTLLEARRECTWRADMAGHQPLHPEGPVTTLLDAEVLIWGFGSIAHTLAPMLTALGARVRGVARSAGVRAGVEVVGAADVDTVLPETDILVSLLPGTEDTRHVIDTRRLDLLPAHAYVVNVGRGSVLDEDALVAALHAGTLGGAALDVMETEPLPPDSPLWRAPGVILTPHCAGGRPVGYGDLLRTNLRALRTGTGWRNRV